MKHSFSTNIRFYSVFIKVSEIILMNLNIHHYPPGLLSTPHSGCSSMLGCVRQL